MSVAQQTISTFARKGKEFLFHLAFLPDVDTQKSVANLSGLLNQTSYTRSFYKLVAGEKGLSFASTKTFSEGAMPLTGRYSLPHMTIMHFWAMPDKAESIAQAFSAAEKEVNLPQFVKANGVSFFSSLPRFLGKEGQNDAVAWIDINRSANLVDLQARFHQAVVEKAGVPISALGDRWNPHWTLLAEPRELITTSNRSIAFNEADLLPSGEKAGEVVLGLSGPNGQFRGVLSSVSEFSAKLMPALGD